MQIREKKLSFVEISIGQLPTAEVMDQNLWPQYCVLILFIREMALIVKYLLDNDNEMSQECSVHTATLSHIKTTC